MDDWEAVKENARPVRHGYKMSALQPLLAGPRDAAQLASEQQAHESKVLANGGSDPLAAWRDYIRWAETNAAATDFAIDRTQLLERCVIQFRAYPQYKNDERYVRIALDYALACENKLEIFQFMEDWGIGVSSAQLYYKWGPALEACGRYTQAEELYQRAASRMTSEADQARLRQAHADFSSRAQLRARAPAEEPSTEGMDDENGPRRSALGAMAVSKSGAIAVDRVAGLSKAPTSGLGLSASVRPSGTMPTSGNVGLVVYDDSAAPAPTAASRSVAPGGMNLYKELPAARTVTKENTQTAGTWTLGGVGGAAHLPPPPPASFTVLVDEPAAESSAPAPKQQQQTKMRPTATGRLAFERTALGARREVQAVSLRDFARERGVARETQDGILGYNPAPLFGTAEEFSFEEIRGQAWCAVHPFVYPAEPLETQSNEDTVDDVDMEGDVNMKGTSVAPSPAPSMAPAISPAVVRGNPAPLAPARSFGSIYEDEPAAPAATAFLASKPRSFSSLLETAVLAAPSVPQPIIIATSAPRQTSRFDLYSEPTMTINTKAAMQEMMAMFGAPLAAEETGAGVKKNEAEEEEDEEPITVGNDTKAGAALPPTSVSQGFAIFEDKTENIRVGDASFSQSTPGAALAARHLQTLMTPIAAVTVPAETAFKVSHPHLTSTAAFAVYEDTTTRTHTLTPILEASGESSSLSLSISSTGQDGHRGLSSVATAAIDVTVSDTTLAAPSFDTITVNTAQPAVENNVDEENEENEEESEEMIIEAEAFPESNARQRKLMCEVHPPVKTYPGFGLLAGNSPAADSEEGGLLELGSDLSLYVQATEQRTERMAVLLTEEVRDLGDDANTAEAAAPGSRYRVKIHAPPCPWEFYVTSAARTRIAALSDIPASVLKSLPTPRCFAHRAASFMLTPCSTHGHTLSDVVALGKVDEPLAAYFAIELMRVLEALHAVGLVHGNLRPASVALRWGATNDDETAAATGDGAIPAGPWVADGSAGWVHRGIRLHDFDEALDLTLTAPGTQFAFDDPDQAEAMPEYASFSAQVDYHGLAVILHILLTGRALDVVPCESEDADETAGEAEPTMWGLAAPLPRYLQVDLWRSIFTALLNAQTAEADLAVARRMLEQYLLRAPSKAALLPGLLAKLEMRLNAA